MKKLLITVIFLFFIAGAIQTKAQSIYFTEASKSRITIKENGKMNFGTGEFTIEAVIKASSKATGYDMIFSKRGLNRKGLFLSLNSYGSPTVQLEGANYFETNTKNLRDDKCHHIAFTRKGDSVLVLVDGATILKALMYNAGNVTLNADVIIGNDESDSFSHGFEGIIKEVRVWNGVRSKAEINEFKEKELSKAEYSSSNLVGYWRLNETSGTSATDLSNSNHLGYLGKESNLTVAPQFSSTGCELTLAPEFNKVLEFNRAQQTRVTIPANNNLNFGTGDFTIEATFKLSSESLGYNMLISKRGAHRNGFFLGLDYGAPIAQLNGANYFENSTIDLRDNECHHIALKRKTDSLFIFVDGIIVEKAQLYSAGDISLDANTIIGNDESDSYQHGFEGTIREIKVWNIAKSNDDIKANLSAEFSGPQTNLAAYWKLNEGTNQAISDYSGNEGDGALGTDAEVESTDPEWIDQTCDHILTGTQKANSNKDLIFYPNPAENLVFVNATENYSYQILDITGTIVLKGNYSENGIDISNLEKGAYILKLDAPSTICKTIFKK